MRAAAALVTTPAGEGLTPAGLKDLPHLVRAGSAVRAPARAVPSGADGSAKACSSSTGTGRSPPDVDEGLPGYRAAGHGPQGPARVVERVPRPDLDGQGA